MTDKEPEISLPPVALEAGNDGLLDTGEPSSEIDEDALDDLWSDTTGMLIDTRHPVEQRMNPKSQLVGEKVASAATSVEVYDWAAEEGDPNGEEVPVRHPGDDDLKPAA